MEREHATEGRGMERATVPCKQCGKPIEIPGGLPRFGPRRPRLTCCQCIDADARKREEERRMAADQAREDALAIVRADLPAALESCGVPPRWMGSAFDSCPDVPPNLQRAVAEWADHPGGMLYLFGATGAGKTWLAVAALRYMLGAGIATPTACRFASERDFLAAIKASFGNSNAPTSPRSMPANHPFRADVLLYDDFGASRLTEWAVGEIAGLIEFRHANSLATIITSNLTPDELATAVDARTLSRIAESQCMLEFPSRDLRVSGSLRKAAAAIGREAVA